MPQPTLFDPGPPTDAPDLGDRQRPEPWLVDALVRLGVLPETASNFTLKQAFTVKSKLERQLLAKEDGPLPGAKVRPLAPPLDEPDTLPARAGKLIRDMGADELDAILADGAATDDELYRFLRGSLYLFDRAELVRVGRGLSKMLRASDGTEGIRRDRAGHAQGAEGGGT